VTAVDDVVKAWIVKGINPQVHDEMKRRLYRDWPTLASALDALLDEHRMTERPTTKVTRATPDWQTYVGPYGTGGNQYDR